MNILDFIFYILNFAFVRTFQYKISNVKCKIVLILLVVFCSSLAGFSQSTRSLINDGNANYKKDKFADAEISYRKSLEKDKSQPYGNYNLGNALLKQQKTDEALQQYQDAISKAKDDDVKSNAYYNMGNAFVESKKYPEAITSYKNALKLNPDDNDAKYNLSYALKMLQQEQQKQQQDNKDKDDKDQEKKDQQQQNQQDQNQNQQQQNDQQKQEQQKQQQQEAQQDQTKQQQAQQAQAKKDDEKKMKKDQAEAILNQLKNNEKKIQKDLRKQPARDSKVEKDW